MQKIRNEGVMALKTGICRWAGGYVRLCVSGCSAERFFNLCKSARLNYWKVSRQREGCYFYMSLEDFFRLRPLLRKSHMSMRVISRAGLPFVLRQNRKRAALGAAVLSFFVLLYMMSLFIWNISFDGNYRYTRETLLGFQIGRAHV